MEFVCYDETMNINIANDAAELGKRAADKIAKLIGNAINEKGHARIVLSTGESQFETLAALVMEEIDWTKVEMFHLDEYVGLDSTHPASFCGYLKKRFISKLDLHSVHLISGIGDVEGTIKEISEEFSKSPIDVGVIGIGENGHIAFNDPPADFNASEIYRIVTLDSKCRAQQVREGWFASIDDVPREAISMTPRAILSCQHIVSAVPHSVKAEAVRNTLASPLTPDVPATLLKTHPDWNLFLDASSCSRVIAL